MRTVVSVQTSLVCSAILRWGTEEQKQHYLPKLCSGEWLGCFGLTEPDTGSDAANQSTRARKTDGGWVINGAKMFISMANHAKVALIFAQTDPEKAHRGLACFLVDTDQPGFQPQAIHHKLGLRGSDTAAISLDDVEVSDDAMLGEVGDGFKVAMSALDSGRYSVAAGCVGICQGCVDASVSYSKERVQFGRPIASFQLVQAMLADMRVQTDAARMLVWRAGYLKDTGKPNTTETSIAKLYATEAAHALRQHRDPGPRRLGLRRRPPGRALPPRRARDHAVRGNLADPEADHRPRADRDQRARPAVTRASRSIGVAGAGTMGAGIAQLACLAGARHAAARPRPRGARARHSTRSGGTSSAAPSAGGSTRTRHEPLLRPPRAGRAAAGPGRRASW